MKMFFLLFCFLLPYAQSAEINKDIDFINLSVGFQYEHQLPENLRGKTLRFEGTYTRYTSVFLKKKDNLLLFKPRRKGTGTLIIKNTKNKILQKITVDVKKVNLHKVAKEIHDLLILIDGIKIKILNNKVIIDGEVLLPKEMDRIDTVILEYNGLVKSLVTLSPKAQNQIARLIEKEIGYLVPPDEVRVKAVHNRFILEGEVSSDDQRKRAGIIANLYTQFDAEGKSTLRRKGVRSVENLIKIREKKQPDTRKKIIQIVVHYVELKKDYTKGFSFQWTPQIQDNTGVQASFGKQGFGLASSVVATISNFFPKLNWAKDFSFARVLHNSNLTLMDGKNGTISTKTNVPYTVKTADGELSTATATSTISTTITNPKVVGPKEDTVEMKVTVNVGSFVGSVDNNPTTNDRMIETHLHIRGGRSAVLGGLISSNLARDYNRLPSQSVRETPIVKLLSSKNYNTGKSQFVIFLTPFIRSSASTGVELVKKKFKLDGY